MLTLANTVCLLALSRYDRHVLALLHRAGLIESCCVVLALDARLQHARTYLKRGPQERRFGKGRLLLFSNGPKKRKGFAGKY